MGSSQDFDVETSSVNSAQLGPDDTVSIGSAKSEALPKYCKVLYNYTVSLGGREEREGGRGGEGRGGEGRGGEGRRGEERRGEERRGEERRGEERREGVREL